MENLCLLPVMGDAEVPVPQELYSMIRVSQDPRPATLAVDSQGYLHVIRAGDIDHSGYAAAKPVGTLYYPEAKSVFLSCLTLAVQVNGMAPLPLVRLEAGDFLMVGGQRWFITFEFIPAAGPAPAELAETPCPVCGGNLGLVNVCQCSCGQQYRHLENPQAEEGADVFNCFLTGPPCGICGRPGSLEAELVPPPPEKILEPSL